MVASTQFGEKLRESLASETFVKLTLSQAHGEPGLRNLQVRIIEVRDGRKLSLVWRHELRDVTKNYDVTKGASLILELIAQRFRRAHLFTTAGDWELRSRDGNERLTASKPAFKKPPSVSHDRQKETATSASAPYLRALEVTNAEGKARPGMSGKLAQIQRFTEVLGHLIADSPLREKKELAVLDMGAGKGYLTFATCDFFASRGVKARVTGIERRPELVRLTNRVAKECGYENLEFRKGEIGAGHYESNLDILIALHACNTATDDALHEGVSKGASLLIAAPCCHQELRAQFTPAAVLRDVLRHGILLEREAEILTDGIRALLLEMHGYKSTVFEFISPEHTGKNLMIAAHKRHEPHSARTARERFRALVEFYGIREQRLAKLLGEL